MAKIVWNDIVEKNPGPDWKLMRKEPEQFWMVAYEEEIVIDVPAQDGIVGTSRRIIKRQTGNEIINVHPVVHGILSLQGDQQTNRPPRRNYTIIYALQIPEKYYDLVMQPSDTETKVNAIADKVEQEKSESKVP